MSLINREALIKEYARVHVGTPGGALKLIVDAPEVVSEIIRCRDCTYWMPHTQLGYDEDDGTYHDYCANLIPEDEYYAFTRDADDFCSRGVRRSTDERKTE